VDVIRDHKVFGLVEPPVVENHDVIAPGKRLREPIEVLLKAVAVETLMLGEKPLAGLRLDGSVQVEVLVSGLGLLDRLHAGEGNSMPRDWHPPDSAFVLAKQTHWPVGLFLQVREIIGEMLLKSYVVVLVFLGWRGRGDFGFAPIW